MGNFHIQANLYGIYLNLWVIPLFTRENTKETTNAVMYLTSPFPKPRERSHYVYYTWFNPGKK